MGAQVVSFSAHRRLDLEGATLAGKYAGAAEA